jgi:hypothetical protein
MRGLVSGSASLAACAFSGSEAAVCQLVSVNAERLSRGREPQKNYADPEMMESQSSALWCDLRERKSSHLKFFPRNSYESFIDRVPQLITVLFVQLLYLLFFYPICLLICEAISQDFFCNRCTTS